MEKSCLNCKKRFKPHPAVRDQRYCSQPECQRARKRTWQREKLARDKDYRENQQVAQREWQKKNPGYFREYRAKHPDYVEQNRQRQRERNHQKRASSPKVIAKMDELSPDKTIISGCYQLIPFCKGGVPIVAKMDELVVELRMISSGYTAGGATSR